MLHEGKIKGMFYEATLKEGSRIYRVFQGERLLEEVSQKELPSIPQRFMDQGLADIANDMIETLPNLKWCTCTICGENFISGSSKLNSSSKNATCSVKCRRVKNANEKKRVKERKDKNNDEAVREAKALGLSYGKYRAYQYMKSIGMTNLPEIAQQIEC